MGRMTRSDFHASLIEGVNAHFGMTMERVQEVWPQIFEKGKANKAWEEDVLRVGLGNTYEIAEGTSLIFDSGADGWKSRYTFPNYVIAFSITEQAIDDNLYGDIIEQMSKSAARAMAHNREVKTAAVFNNAFSSSYAGGDGVALCDASHPLWEGGTWANEPSAGGDLSEDTLENGIIAMSNFVDDRGIPQGINCKKLLVAPNEQFNAHRILNSTLQSGTANNDINAMKSMSSIPDGIAVWNKLTDPDAWFLLSDCDDGLKFMQRKGVVKKTDDDFLTGSFMVKMSERFGVGWSNPRCVYGNPGG